MTNINIICLTTGYDGTAVYHGGGSIYTEGDATIDGGGLDGDAGYIEINGQSCPAIKRVIELGKAY